MKEEFSWTNFPLRGKKVYWIELYLFIYLFIWNDNIGKYCKSHRNVGAVGPNKGRILLQRKKVRKIVHVFGELVTGTNQPFIDCCPSLPNEGAGGAGTRCCNEMSVLCSDFLFLRETTGKHSSLIYFLRPRVLKD